MRERMGLTVLFLVIVGLLVLVVVIRSESDTGPPPGGMVPAVAGGIWAAHVPSAPGASASEAACRATQTRCAQWAAGLMNAQRAAVGSPALHVDWSLVSPAVGTCVKAGGHVAHLVAVVTTLSAFGNYAHDQFPAELACLPYHTIGQNVGEHWGSKADALAATIDAMMAEGHSALGSCLAGHDCAITYRGFTAVGIAFGYSGALGGWIIVMDFLG